jgi:putative phosphoesterase
MQNKDKQNSSHTIGVISDTHGLLRPEVYDAFHNVERIIHAGDIGSEKILQELENIAPVTAVRGNMDRDEMALKLHRTETVELKNMLLYVIHDIGRLDIDPKVSGVKAVIFGHSHKPTVHKHDGVLYINPGSAGARRFSLPVSVGLIHINSKGIRAEVVKLKV